MHLDQRGGNFNFKNSLNSVFSFSNEGRCNGTVECLSGNDEIDCQINLVTDSKSPKLLPGQIKVNVLVIL